MPVSKPATQLGASLGAAALAITLCACAPEAVPEFSPPTMAPEQSATEACGIMGEEVDRITLEVEQQIQQGIGRAFEDLASGNMPELDFVSDSLGTTLAELQQEVDNPELRSAVGELRDSLQQIGEIAQPESLLDVPGYLGSIKEQLGSFTEAGTRLQQLCTAGQ